jgi:hypothetical protein
MKRTPILLTLFMFVILACGQATSATTPTPIKNRISSIPATAIKHSPTDDFWPPTAATGWSQPVPMPGPVNTAGGEDSPFLTLDGNDLYFFFTPDVSIPAEKQLLDGVTGIWVAHRFGETWTEPERVWLEKRSDLALDGCPFVFGNVMYFCTTRAGYTGIQWFRADFKDDLWQNWLFAGEELKQNEYDVGELHITAEGQELYFHSHRAGGYGGLDIWVLQKTAGGWGEPINLGPTVNTSADEGWPCVSPDGQELWITGQSTKGRPGPAIFRSLRQPDRTWGAVEEIISTFAGESTLSADGRTLYFVHHYYSENMSKMLEADIYVSYRMP